MNSSHIYEMDTPALARYICEFARSQITQSFVSSATGFQMIAACDELLKRLEQTPLYRYPDGTESWIPDELVPLVDKIVKKNRPRNLYVQVSTPGTDNPRIEEAFKMSQITAKIEEMVRQCQRREIERLEAEATAFIADGHKIEELTIYNHNGDRWVGLKTDSAHDALLRRQQRVPGQ